MIWILVGIVLIALTVIVLVGRQRDRRHGRARTDNRGYGGYDTDTNRHPSDSGGHDNGSYDSGSNDSGSSGGDSGGGGGGGGGD